MDFITNTTNNMEKQIKDLIAKYLSKCNELDLGRTREMSVSNIVEVNSIISTLLNVIRDLERLL